MDVQSYKTKHLNAAQTQRKWWVIEGGDLPLGRLCTTIASLLRGKHKPSFTPNVDGGDSVIVLNAQNVCITRKEKVYTRHTGYPGGQRKRTFEEWKAKDPRQVVFHAVKGMLPKTRLGRKMGGNLHIYEGELHPHAAQKPEKINIS